MTERPIHFNDAMVRAILRGKKSQTRRPVMPQLYSLYHYVMEEGTQTAWCVANTGEYVPLPGRNPMARCPFGRPGDRLWVRETFSTTDLPKKVHYRADDVFIGRQVRWTPAIYMPRSLSRITLEITDINVDRVQDIAEKDAWAEGMEALDGSFNEATLCATAKRYHLCVEDSRCIYAHLWDLLYAKRGLGWDANPWVWVIKFKTVEQ